MDDGLTEHWDAFYAARAVPLVPSQFGAFIAGEYPDSDLIVDFGCGNGRDTMLFAGQGKRVIAVDGSQGAIQSAKAAASDAGAVSVAFVHGAIDAAETWLAIRAAMQSAPPRSPTLYARFFLHAIDEPAEAVFLDQAADLLHGYGGQLCLEFRTPNDEGFRKWAGEHYRRYIALPELIDRLELRGLGVCYAVEGFGYARFRGEDAHVARVICSRA